MVLGENIGTTITANLAAIVGNVFAKRAARAHLIFNIFGVLWMLFLLPVFLKGIDWYMSSSQNISPFDTNHPESIPIALSIFHTSFNIINTLVLVWFANFIARIVTKMVPATGDDEYHLEFIGSQLIRTPDMSILEARKEIAQFGEITSKMSGYVQTLMDKKKDKKRAKLLDKIQRYEEITDKVEVEVARYLSKVAEGNLSVESSNRIRGLLSINNDLERVGDHYYQIALAVQRKNESDLWFTDKQYKNLMSMFHLVDQAMEIMVENLNKEYGQINIESAQIKEKEIDARRNELRREHLRNIEKGNYDIRSSLIYSDIFSIIERIGDHVYSVSRALVMEN
jgi:phosphate:Na+ symporter